jgi:hypothetical protein
MTMLVTNAKAPVKEATKNAGNTAGVVEEMPSLLASQGSSEAHSTAPSGANETVNESKTSSVRLEAANLVIVRQPWLLLRIKSHYMINTSHYPESLFQQTFYGHSNGHIIIMRHSHQVRCISGIFKGHTGILKRHCRHSWTFYTSFSPSLPTKNHDHFLERNTRNFFLL